MRAPLPIDPILPDVTAALRGARGVVVVAPPGSGKTTRIPPALLDSIDGRILVLEPRRVAVRAAARRMADEGGWTLGREVGYQVRFERRASAGTRILVATEGTVVRMLQDDPFLDGVGCVLVDELHERSIHADMALAMLRHVQRELRPDLALGAMSATLDPEPVSAFLGGCPVVTAGGRLHPVEVRYLDAEPTAGPERTAAEGVVRVLDESPGDVLVFLPGVREIRRTQDLLEGPAAQRGLSLLPLYGDLPAERQDQALRPGSRRKVVLATNVAESSVTIPGVTAVVDVGLAHQPRHDPRVGLDRLERVRISQRSADQRAGRAGRTAPGLCLRLWTEAQQAHLRESDEPEVRRVDLAGPALRLLAWGEAPGEFDWFDRPPEDALDRARELLRRLGAADDGGITPLGRRLATLPLHPRLGRLLVEGRRLGHTDAAARLAVRLGEGRAGRGRGPTRAQARAEQQLRRLAQGLPAADEGADEEQAIGRALLAAYPDRVARRRAQDPSRGRMVGGTGVWTAAGVLTPDTELFVCVDLAPGRRGERAEARVRWASPIERDWLPPEQVKKATELRFDADLERVVARRVTRYGDLVLDERAVTPEHAPAVADILARAAAAALERALGLDSGPLHDLLARWRFLRLEMPGMDLPEPEALLVEQVLPLLCPGRSSFAELRRSPAADSMMGLLSRTQRRALDEHAPQHWRVPGGRQVALEYPADAPPILAARIQELFGLADTPRLAGGLVPVRVHLLAPNMRPAQVTRDLRSFWDNTYAEVRKELRARYPKHDWPEDPWKARATSRPGRRRRG